MSRFKKIIFLDEGNTMLSPYAEAFMRGRLLLLGANKIQVASRGSIVLFPEPVNPKILIIAGKKGFSLAYHKASEIRESDFSDTTLVLTMDEENKNRLYQKYPSAKNVFSIKSYLEKTGDLRPPIGGSVEEYERVCAELEELIEKLAQKETGS